MLNTKMIVRGSVGTAIRYDQALLPANEAKALAEKLTDLLTTTDIAKGGCTVCGHDGHVAIDTTTSPAWIPVRYTVRQMRDVRP